MRRWAKRVAGALAVFVLILAAPILWVEVSCTTAREPGTLTRAPLVQERGYARREADSYLSFPEWHIVYAYEDLAGVLRRGNESDFAYGRQILGFWTSLCGLTRVVTARGPVGLDTRIMLYAIGWSFTAELAIKGAYESTIGHAFERLRGHAKTAEDEFTARDVQAYAEFLRQTPWYEYPFGWRLLAFWRSTPLRGDGLARKIERRIVFTVEYATKAVYGALIGYASGAALGASDLEIQTVVAGLEPGDAAREPKLRVVRELGGGRTLSRTPRYQTYTDLLVRLARRGATSWRSPATTASWSPCSRRRLRSPGARRRRALRGAGPVAPGRPRRRRGRLRRACGRGVRGAGGLGRLHRAHLRLLTSPSPPRGDRGWSS
jgi:hypothetical protein